MQYNPYAPNPQLQMESVASIEDAKRFRVFPGQTVYLLDQEQPMIYMKSANQEGGVNLRAFALSEIEPSSITDPRYISRSDFEAFKKEMMEAKAGIGQSNKRCLWLRKGESHFTAHSTNTTGATR